MLKNKDLAWSYDSLVGLLKILHLNDLYLETINFFHIVWGFSLTHQLTHLPILTTYMHAFMQAYIHNIHTSVYWSICLSVSPCICLFIHPSTQLFISSLTYPTAYPPTHLSISSSSIFLFIIYLSIYTSTHPLSDIPIDLATVTCPKYILGSTLSNHMSIFMSTLYSPWIFLHNHAAIFTSLYLFIYPHFCLFIHLPVHLSIKFSLKANFGQEHIYVPERWQRIKQIQACQR